MENRFPNRKHPRLDSYDYSAPGAYFVTICTHNKRCLLSEIMGNVSAPVEIRYTGYGKIALEQLFLLEKRYPALKVDRHVIMPNHIHAILILHAAAGEKYSPALTDIICAYKSLTTRECKRIKPIEKVFQTSFYEHVIRGEADYLEIARYIEENPLKWELDKLYSKEQNFTAGASLPPFALEQRTLRSIPVNAKTPVGRNVINEPVIPVREDQGTLRCFCQRQKHQRDQGPALRGRGEVCGLIDAEM